MCIQYRTMISHLSHIETHWISGDAFLWGFSGKQCDDDRPKIDGYHLVMTNTAMENHHAINR